MWWLAGLAALQAASIDSAPGSATFDVQCLVVTQAAASAIDNQELALATRFATMFFLGRVDQRFSDAQLIEESLRVSETMRGKPIGPVLQACGDFMKARGERIERIGEQIEKREELRKAN